MPSIEAVAIRMASTGIPILFLDTCILLDIIRSTNRCLGGYAELALGLWNLATAEPPGCVLVVSSLVPGEWSSNVDNVADEVIRHLAKIQEQSSHFHDACQALGIHAGFGRAAYSGRGLTEGLRDLAGRLLGLATHLDPDDECRVRAVGRIIDNSPPARRGGGEVKDCTIIEEYLTVCRRLEAVGHSGKRVFCSSNTKDYCDSSKNLHPSLDLEFGAVGLIFKTNLAGAVHEIGI